MIDNYWTDGVIYIVKFTSDLRNKKSFYRTIILNREYEENEIKELLQRTFSDSTISLLNVDYFSEGLVLKTIG